MIKNADWIHNDKAWCGNYDCALVSCIRNPKNIKNPDEMHSFAAFMMTEECPIYVMEMNAALERDDENDR